MTKPALEVEALVDALRADLPTDADRERVRARLLAAGVALSASVAASSTAAAAAVGAGGAAAAGGAKAGLFSQLSGLSLAAKVSMVTTVVVVSVALPIAATRMHETPARKAPAVAAVKAHARAGETRPDRASDTAARRGERTTGAEAAGRCDGRDGSLGRGRAAGGSRDHARARHAAARTGVARL